MPPKKINFEKALAELEQIVEKIEQGQLSLEESLAYFERGITLTKTCREALAKAEQSVQSLIEKEGKTELVKFKPED